MERRAFLAISGRTALLALAAAKRDAAGQMQATPAAGEIEKRLAAVVEAYDAQGNHRTATEVDRRSGEWLAAQMRQLGIVPSLEPLNASSHAPAMCALGIAELTASRCSMPD